MEIKLGGKKGGVALVSAEDYELVSKYSWNKTDQGYASGNVNGKQMLMHIFIMGLQEGNIIDHINHNRIDNRRENLRFLDVPKNNGNKAKAKGKSSQYRNVYLDKKRNKFCSQISINGKTMSLGSHDSEIQAAEAFDMYVVHNKLDYIDLNFPEQRENYLKKEYNPPQSLNRHTQYQGVSNSYSKFATIIRSNGKQKTIFTSEDPIECANKYDEYIITNNIPNKKLNFPEKYPDYDPRIIKTAGIKIDKTTMKLVIPNDNRAVLISIEDYDKVKYYKCHIEKKYGYAMISKDRKCIPLSRFLMDVTDPKIFVDHINSNVLDNTRKNLRLSNVKLNGQNRSKNKNMNGSSKYMGVSFCNRYKGWICRLRTNRKVVFHFQNKNEIVAARKRDLYIMDHPETHYKLNFKWTKKDIKIWREYFN